MVSPTSQSSEEYQGPWCVTKLLPVLIIQGHFIFYLKCIKTLYQLHILNNMYGVASKEHFEGLWLKLSDDAEYKLVTFSLLRVDH